MNQVVKTVSYKLSLLQKLRPLITRQAAIQIYKSMVIPYFDYGDILYNCSSEKLFTKLQKLQNRGLKICFGNGNRQKYNNYLLDIRDIRTRAHDAILYNTKQPRCEKYKHNIYYYSARLWNQLPVKERKIDDYDTFKNVQKLNALS